MEGEVLAPEKRLGCVDLEAINQHDSELRSATTSEKVPRYEQLTIITPLNAPDIGFDARTHVSRGLNVHFYGNERRNRCQTRKLAYM